MPLVVLVIGIAIGAIGATAYWLKGIGDSIGRHF
jgi:hypothetical protein